MSPNQRVSAHFSPVSWVPYCMLFSPLDSVFLLTQLLEMSVFPSRSPGLPLETKAAKGLAVRTIVGTLGGFNTDEELKAAAPTATEQESGDIVLKTPHLLSKYTSNPDPAPTGRQTLLALSTRRRCEQPLPHHPHLRTQAAGP